MPAFLLKNELSDWEYLGVNPVKKSERRRNEKFGSELLTNEVRRAS